ncbi:cytochrome b [Alkalilimnicola ehrlichii MLHE-1]|uniref:Cytochrome B561 n=1 Tax=Alkalilimnicola ehrlichii (strain ATCC BAA-1101 / DSM 17681 / MLHE-1) TaxID=187272 RepID=Q0A8T4_ALKEH|nr:cytochrome b [Alkalilimnicola ehrlichii]ABI56753.1 cytochrome B561 [Alkalilimnicola ehrlichii MLHE-1]
MLRGNDLRYGWVARLFHWLMALLLLALFATGWWATELSYYDPLYNTVPHWHRSLGVLAGLLICLRLAWLLVDRRPPHPPQQPAWERLAAGATHWLLYGLMIAVPVTGYLLSTADGRPVDVFGLFQVPALLPRSSGREEIAADLHYYLAFGGAWLVLLHIAAALKHALIDRDGVLRRMIG